VVLPKAPKMIKKETYEYTNHKQWDTLTSQTLKVLEAWYESNNSQYNHIKHAFNSMCKHYEKIDIIKYTIKLSTKRIIIWKLTSFTDKSWLYYDDNKSLSLIAFMTKEKRIIKDKKLAHLLKMIN
jgi:enoyl-[acyl-carrier-protein] reductase (NADH)